MGLKISHPFWQVISLGALAGMRTASAPTIASHILTHHPSKKLAGSALNFMQSDKAALAFKAFAIAEFVGDKLPGTPNRIKPSALVARCLSGSLVGAAIYKSNGNNAFAGAALGLAAAFCSTFGSFYLRKNVVSTTHIADPLIGAVEDVLVIGTGIVLISQG
jgi:uncharacterized membrane protein